MEYISMQSGSIITTLNISYTYILTTKCQATTEKKPFQISSQSTKKHLNRFIWIIRQIPSRHNNKNMN
ncbi:hypothetical protein DERF_000141 [Dermatophagoides farinae]|uniref:Uncharacterized protein n=1 Tax=Dermatophagoides farinae TaxID=6954 RepID=A0A922I822_DERFA|nr:hypothetical protein DERF_000141 [Dermatophagoides farinae]